MQGLANIAWSVGAYTSDWEAALFVPFAMAVEPRLSGFSFWAIANTVWAFAKVA